MFWTLELVGESSQIRVLSPDVEITMYDNLRAARQHAIDSEDPRISWLTTGR